MTRSAYIGSEIVRETLFTSTPAATTDYQYKLGPGAWLISVLVDFNAVTGTAILGAALVNSVGTKLFEEGLVTLTNATPVASTDTAGAALTDLVGIITFSTTTAGTTGGANNLPIAVYDDICFRYVPGTTAAASAVRVEMIAVRVG